MELNNNNKNMEKFDIRKAKYEYHYRRAVNFLRFGLPALILYVIFLVVLMVKAIYN